MSKIMRTDEQAPKRPPLEDESRLIDRAAVANRYRTVLGEEDWEAVLTAFDRPGEPTQALRRMMALHRQQTRNDDRCPT